MTDLALRRREVEAKRQQHERRIEPRKRTTIGQVFERGGSIDVPNNPAHVWVHDFGTDYSYHKVFNPGFTLQAGDFVYMAFDPTSPRPWRIIGLYFGDVLPSQLANLGRRTIGSHGENHQQPTEATIGSDPVDIYQPAMMMLKTKGDGATLSVEVYPLIYQFGGYRRYFSGEDALDLTSYVPGSGLVRNVLIYLNKQTNALAVSSGTAVSSGGGVPIPVPAFPDDSIVSCYVQLTNGQTAITTATHITDCRAFLTGQQESSIPAATAEGQILIADASLNWVAGLPVVDSNGDIVTSGGQIVYTT